MSEHSSVERETGSANKADAAQSSHLIVAEVGSAGLQGVAVTELVHVLGDTVDIVQATVRAPAVRAKPFPASRSKKGRRHA